MDDHLLVLERGVEVRSDAHLPAGRVRSPAGRRHGERLRRRPFFAPFVERALLELVCARLLELGPPCSRALRAGRRDDDHPPGDRIAPEFR
jgi:hypothetical protein